MRRASMSSPWGLALPLSLSLVALAFSAEGLAQDAPPFADGPDGKAGPPFADGPDAPAVAPRPATRTWGVEDGNRTFAFQFTPGIPEPGKVTEVLLAVTERPKVPDARWGMNVPQIDARLVAEWLSPAGQVLSRYLLHPMPLALSKYGFHVTPDEAGIHRLRLVGKLKSGEAVRVELKVPVDVWPLPEELAGAGKAAASRRPAVRRPVTAN